MSNQESTSKELEWHLLESYWEWHDLPLCQKRELQAGPKYIKHARKWLPETVYTWALNALRSRSNSNPDQTFMDPTVDLLAVLHVAMDERMQDVWRLLSLPRVGPDKALEYFQLAVTAALQWQCDHFFTFLKKDVEEVAHLCGRLATAMKKSGYLFKKKPTEARYFAAYQGECGDEALEWLSGSGFNFHRNTYRNGIGAFMHPSRGVDADFLATYLTEVSDYCNRELAKRRKRLPRSLSKKRLASSARTYAIRRLAEFMTRVLGKPHYDAIATTVMVALDLSEDLDGELVRKLLSSTRRKPVTTDLRVRRLDTMIKKGMPLSTASAKAGVSEPTARKYQRAGKLPRELKASHTWRTHPDPFAEVWPEVEVLLKCDGRLDAKAVFEDLGQRHPGRFRSGQLRTLQRRIRDWRARLGS